MPKSGALKQVDDTALISRIANGEYANKIAAELGVHHSSIYRRLAQHPEYALARETAWEYRLDEALQEIEGAADPCTLARGRERFRAIAWRAEREFPSRWGQRSHVTVEHAGDLADRLRRANERTIEHDSGTVEPKSLTNQGL